MRYLILTTLCPSKEACGGIGKAGMISMTMNDVRVVGRWSPFFLNCVVLNIRFYEIVWPT